MTIEKAEIVSIKLSDGSDRMWHVDFRVPNSSLDITRFRVSIDPTKRPERGPEEEKHISEVIEEAHKSLANGLWKVFKSAIEAAPNADKWDRLLKEAQALAGAGVPDPDEP